MAQNFLACDREQAYLMPPSLRDWLPADELAWCVLDAVAEMDLSAIYAGYRADGHGRAAHDPAMMVALLLYAYAVGERSSRGIERRCRADVAFRVIAANQAPDHATIARFRVRHQNALGEQIAAEILAEADAVDAAEDALFGERRGDELPAELADPTSRRARLREAKRQLDAEHQAAEQAHREQLQERAKREAELGRKLGGRKPKPPGERVDPQARMNVTDLDSRSVRTPRGFIQGYNAQAVATADQIIIAADVIVGGTDQGLLEPMIHAAVAELAAAGIDLDIDVALADAGYWKGEQIQNLWAAGIQALIPPDGAADGQGKGDPRRGGGLYDYMRRVLASEHGKTRYRQRGRTIEPIFGQTKYNRRADRFQRRGRAACRSEWRLITATHNLLKYWRAAWTPAAA